MTVKLSENNRLAGDEGSLEVVTERYESKSKLETLSLGGSRKKWHELENRMVNVNLGYKQGFFKVFSQMGKKREGARNFNYFSLRNIYELGKTINVYKYHY